MTKTHKLYRFSYFHLERESDYSPKCKDNVNHEGFFDSIAAQVPALNVALIYLWESKIFGQITLENLTRQSRFLMQELGPLPRETTFRKSRYIYLIMNG